MEGILVFLAMLAISERDFFDTAVEQQKQGYRWEKIECRTPNDDLPSLVMTTGTGKRLVCHKLQK